MEPSGLFAADDAALLVIDMQRAFCDPDGGLARAGRDVSAQDAIVPATVTLVRAARGAGLPVIWTLQEGLGADETARLDRRIPRLLGRADAVTPQTWAIRNTRDAELVDALRAELAPEDHVVHKHRMSSFYETTLDAILRIRRRRTLIVAGVNTEKCVESTVRDASFRDYDVVVVAEAVATTDRAFHDDSLRKIDRYFGVVLPLELIVAELASTGPAVPATVG